MLKMCIFALVGMFFQSESTHILPQTHTKKLFSQSADEEKPGLLCLFDPAGFVW